MSAALDLFLARAPREEGRRVRAYNDATGKLVTCQPGGNLSIGEGINLENGLDDVEIDFLTTHRAALVEQALTSYAWWAALYPAAQSVLIDLGYNAGVGGLLHFPRMLAALSADPPDYATAANECHVADPRLDASRYAPLRAILTAAAGAG